MKACEYCEQPNGYGHSAYCPREIIGELREENAALRIDLESSVETQKEIKREMDDEIFGLVSERKTLRSQLAQLKYEAEVDACTIECLRREQDELRARVEQAEANEVACKRIVGSWTKEFDQCRARVRAYEFQYGRLEDGTGALSRKMDTNRDNPPDKIA